MLYRLAEPQVHRQREGGRELGQPDPRILVASLHATNATWAPAGRVFTEMSGEPRTLRARNSLTLPLQRQEKNGCSRRGRTAR